MIGRALRRLLGWVRAEDADRGAAPPTTIWSASEHLIVERYADPRRPRKHWRTAVLVLVLAASLAAAGYLLARPPARRSPCPNIVPRGLVTIRVSGPDQGCLLRGRARPAQTARTGRP